MARFDIGNLVADPFALATVSISSLAWLIAFVASIVAQVQVGFPNYYWWSVAYMFCIIIGIAVVLASNTANVYGVAIVGYTTAGFVITSLAVDGLLQSEQPAKQASAAGLILLCMMNILWVFYFGSTSQSRSRSYIDSFSPHKEQPSYRNSKPISNNFGNRPETTISGSQAPQMYTSAQLGGLETSSPISNTYGGAGSTTTPGSTMMTNTQPTGLGNTNTAPAEQPSEVARPTEYPYRAKAVYSYEANPDDANEISFAKNEILEVSDVSGRWWQAKRSTGETGIAPSNYLVLL